MFENLESAASKNETPRSPVVEPSNPLQERPPVQSPAPQDPVAEQRSTQEVTTVEGGAAEISYLPTRSATEIRSTVAAKLRELRQLKQPGSLEIQNLAIEILQSSQQEAAPTQLPDYLKAFYQMDSGFGALEPEQRLETINAIVEHSSKPPQVSRRIKGILFQMMRSCSPAEREVIARTIEDRFTSTPSSRRGIFHELLLSSTANFDELQAVVEALGARLLFDLRNRELSALVSEVVVVSALRKLRTPAVLKRIAPSSKIRDTLNAIEESLDNEIDALESLGWFKKTEATTRARTAAEELLRYFESERKRRRGPDERRELCQTMSVLLKAHRLYNFRFSFQWNDRGSSVRARWTYPEVKDLLNGIQQTSEVLLITTGKLRHFSRQKGTDELTFGDRLADGRIRIFDFATDRSQAAAHYNRISPLKLTVTHEIFHAIKFGWHTDGHKNKAHIGELSQASNPIVNFGDFVKISDWRIIEPGSYRVLNGGSSVEIEGMAYPVNRVTSFGRDEIILRFDAHQRTLYRHAANAEFVLEDYSTTNPWEDFVEMLTVYKFIPKQLIDYAPLKFVFAEQLFGDHTTNQELKRRLLQRLSRAQP
jgi:hypothetical protein